LVAEARRIVFMPGKPTVRQSYSEAAYQTAVAALERAAQPQVDQLRLYDQLARWHQEQRQTVEAIADLERVVAMDPSHGDARTRLIALRQPTRAGFGARVAVYGNGAAGKRVALTFDDGPNPLFTARILELLAQYGAKGTFFVVGSEASAYPDLVRRITTSGNELANHTYSHANLAQQTPAIMQQEVLRNKVLLRSLGGQLSDLVRPPGGNYGPAVREAMNQIGFRPVLWTCNASNFNPPTTAQLVQTVLDHIHPGGIVLLHNGKDRTLELLPGLLAGLKARGYRMVTVSELIGNGH
jgi:peptidoglycan-N-acetylglucosamine deacetylase